MRPEVARVFEARALAREAEGLAGAGTCPDGPVILPPGPPQSVAPDSDPGEEVALSVSLKVTASHLCYRPCVHVAGGDVTEQDQLSQPLGRERVVFVVYGPWREQYLFLEWCEWWIRFFPASHHKLRLRCAY